MPTTTNAMNDLQKDNSIKPIETRYKGYRFRSRELPSEPGKKVSRRADYSGRRFGRALAIDCLGVAKGGYRWWGLVCDCGVKFAARSRELARGHTRSCGCLQRETLSASGGHNRKPAGRSSFNQLLGSYKKSAKDRGYDFNLTDSLFREMVESPCHYCGDTRSSKAPMVKGTNGAYFYTGIDSVDNDRGYVDGNVRPCCKQCNFAKGTLTERAFLDWLRRAAARSARFEHGEVG